MNEALYRLVVAATKLAAVAEANNELVEDRHWEDVEEAVNHAVGRQKEWEAAYYKLVEENIQLRCRLEAATGGKLMPPYQPPVVEEVDEEGLKNAMKVFVDWVGNGLTPS